MSQGSMNVRRRTRRAGEVTESGIDMTRMKIIRFFMLLALAIVVVQCFLLQVVRREEILIDKGNQGNAIITIPATRGDIIDCNGEILASNKSSKMLLVHPQQIDASDVDRITDELTEALKGYNRSRDFIYARVSDTVNPERKGRTSTYIIVRQLDVETANKIEKLKLGAGVELTDDVTRTYPKEKMLSQVLGFVNTDGDGIAGVEKKFNSYLSGRRGRYVAELTGTGARYLYSNDEKIEADNGAQITLTIDANLQRFLENALEQAVSLNNSQNAQGIILDVTTGAILAISTKPDFDPNHRPQDADELNSLSRNRVVCDSYEPGSVFKIITLASAIDSHTVSTDYSISCSGASYINGERIKCWRSQGHGQQTLTQCAENSCNVAFMDLAIRMGNETFYDYIYKFGFGEVTSCGLPGEGAGIVTHPKRVRVNDLARIGFGQSISVTPIQLATAVAAVVNGGNLMQPYIVDSIIAADGKVIQKTEPVVIRRVISADTSKTVCGILESVVENGSGKNAQIPGYRIGGKTGTSQKSVDGKVSSSKLIASFIGIAPIDNPKYLCLILVDEPNIGGMVYGSTVAAPFVKDVLDQTLVYAGYKKDTGAETVTVPKVIGMYVNDAIDKLAQYGLSADFYTRDGKVAVQIPEQGAEVAKGSQVLLCTADAPVAEAVEKVEVPRLVGLSRYKVYETLEALGLKMEVVSDYNGGDCTSQYPYYGDRVAVGSTVQVKFAD